MLGGDAMAHGAPLEGLGETSGAIVPYPSGTAAVVSTARSEPSPVQAFLVALATIAVAEIGDRTQLLSLALAAHYRAPWPIIAGILVATIANHSVAGALGAWFGAVLTPTVLDFVVGASMVGMALWVLRADTLSGAPAVSGKGAFLATLVAFFIAEIGDKTQIATMALAAAYPNLVAVVAGTTAGMLIANVPAVFLGGALSGRLPIRAMNYVAAVIFALLGLVFVARAVAHWIG
jgi:Ca2+/H+ antiporter, TMEM165/GDT1 family